MRKIILVCVLAIGMLADAQNVQTIAKPLKLNVVGTGNNTDNLLVIGTDKVVKQVSVPKPTLEQVLKAETWPAESSMYVRNVAIGSVIPNTSPGKPNYEGIIIGNKTKISDAILSIETEYSQGSLTGNSVFIHDKSTGSNAYLDSRSFHINDSAIYGTEAGIDGREMVLPENDGTGTDRQTFPIKINRQFADKYGNISLSPINTSFTTNDGKTVIVTNGVITNIY